MSTPNPLPCGCRASLSQETLMFPGTWHVTHCPLHAAAPDLLAACKLWDQGFVDGEEFSEEQLLAWLNANRRAARAAIAKAEPPAEKGE